MSQTRAAVAREPPFGSLLLSMTLVSVKARGHVWEYGLAQGHTHSAGEWAAQWGKTTEERCEVEKVRRALPVSLSLENSGTGSGRNSPTLWQKEPSGRP